MKTGDKIVCIKDLVIKQDGDNPYRKDFAEIVKKFHHFEITIEEFEMAREKYNEKQKEYRIAVVFLTKGKVYEITFKCWDGTIRIKNDTGSPSYFSVNDKKSEYAAAKYEDYFITLIESRKKKLEDVADENFSQFLKKLKK